MKKMILIILLLLLSTPGQAARDEDSGTVSNRENRQQEVPAGQKAENKTRPDSPVDSAWPRTFVPTEKINADTVVSFPADI